MNQPTIYIVWRSNELRFATKSLLLAWSWMNDLCIREIKEVPHSYVQVTRLMEKESCYIHHSGTGEWFKIEIRNLMRTAVQRRISTVAREGVAAGV